MNQQRLHKLLLPRSPVRIPLSLHILLLIILATILAAGFAALAWLALGQPQMQTRSPWTTANSFDLAKLVLAVTGGVGAVVALVIAYRKQQLGEAAEKREDTKLLAERFSKSAEQIGSDKAATRLAGIYSLASLADDWPEGRQTCIDVLCAYLRMPYDPPALNTKENTTQKDRDTTTKEEQQVRHTVIRLVSTHLQEGSKVSWQGHKLDFTGAIFDGGDFSRCIFRDAAISFANAHFVDGVTEFVRAKFKSGDVNFNGSTFEGGTVDFLGAEFCGTWTRFGYIKFLDGYARFQKANFSSGLVTFGSAKFKGGVIDFNEARFQGCDVTFGQADFIGTKISFSDADFSGGTVDFSRVSQWSSPPEFDNIDRLPNQVSLPASAIETAQLPASTTERET